MTKIFEGQAENPNLFYCFVACGFQESLFDDMNTMFDALLYCIHLLRMTLL